MASTSQPLYPEDALLPGFDLNGYIIKKVLGRGAFGITYLAEETHLERLVAIKEYLPEIAAVRDQDSQVHARSGEQGRLFRYGLESFLAEAKTLVKFNNPNIVRVLNYFPHHGTAYLVMEYEVGMDLNHFLQKNPQPSEDALIRIFSPINKGLAAVHASGYIHRDIKADNIYIREDESPVLLDFGAARSVLSNDLNQLTRILTIGYAPYEQDNPTWAEQGPWTDIYALGATLYYCVTGRRPVSATERAGAIISNQKDPLYSALSLKPPGYSLHFLAAIDKALRFRPEERPQSIGEWDAMLNNASADAATIISLSEGDKTEAPDMTVIRRNDGKQAATVATAQPLVTSARKSRAGTGLVLTGLLLAGTGAGAFLLLNLPGNPDIAAITEQEQAESAPVTTTTDATADDGKASVEDQIATRQSEPLREAPLTTTATHESTEKTDKPVAMIDTAEPPPVPTQEKTNGELEQSKSLVLSTMVLAKTACWHYARGQKITELIDKIKALPETSDRTKFIVDQNRKLNEAQSGFESNFAQYNESLEKLRGYDKNTVESAIQAFFQQPQYENDQTYRKLGDTLLKHTHAETNNQQTLKSDLMTISTSGVFSES